MSKENWINSPADLILQENEIHIFYADITTEKKYRNILENFLSDEEKFRAAKFVYEKDRMNYIISRGILKDILSRYLSIDADKLIISHDEYGKPFLDSDLNHNKLIFNLSHSGDLTVYAVSRERKLGIDVQILRKIESADEIIQQNFSDIEIALFNSLPSGLHREAFYSCWTRKEAYAKAHGRGLSYPFNKFSVSIHPGENAILLHDENDKTSRWSLKEVFLTPEYAAAVAAEGNNLKYNYYRWVFNTRFGISSLYC